MINVLAYLDEAAKCCPNKIAFSDGSASLSFSGLRTCARAVGTALAKAGHIREPVFVWMPRSPDMIAAFFGAVYAGSAYVPADPEIGRARAESILQSLQPRAILCDGKTRPLLDAMPHDARVYEYEDLCATAADDALLDSIRADAIDTDLLYIVYTSGSTGTPKGVAACHRSVIDYVESLSAALGFDGDTVFGNQTPLYVDACLKELYPTLKYGATAYLIPKELFLFPLRLLEYLEKHQINTICWVVSALTILSGTGALEKTPPRTLRTIAFGSELFAPAQLSRWRAALPEARFFNLYGPTECTGMSCYYELPHDFPADTPPPIGKPFANTRILLFDGDRLVTEPGEEGEICILGTGLTLGYYGEAEKTNAVFTQNPLQTHYRERMYRSGDMGKRDESGNLLFCARRDQQIKHMGHRIEPGEIETAASACEGVSRAVCLYETQKQKLMLFYTGGTTPKDLMLFLRERLPRFLCPNAIIPLETMPLTANGKIDRQALGRVGTQTTRPKNGG